MSVLEMDGYSIVGKHAARAAGLSFLLHTRVIDELRDKDVMMSTILTVHCSGLITEKEILRLGYWNEGYLLAFTSF